MFSQQTNLEIPNMMPSFPSRQRRGFTLIELLVVISIIALLISILLPSLSSARRTAQVVGCLSNIRQIGMAQVMYGNDNEGHFTAQLYTSAPNVGISYDELLSHYDGRSGLSREFASNTQFLKEGEGSPLYQCPLENLPRGWGVPEDDFGNMRRSYALNRGTPFSDREANPTSWSARHNPGIHSSGATYDPNRPQWSASADSLRDSSGTVILADYAATINFQGWPNGGDMSIWEVVRSNRGFYPNGPYYPVGPSRSYAHETKVGADPTPSAAFADGHAETVSLKEELTGAGFSYADPQAIGTRFDAMK